MTQTAPQTNNALDAVLPDVSAYFSDDQAPATEAPENQEQSTEEATQEDVEATDNESGEAITAEGETEADAGEIVDLDALPPTHKFKLQGEEFTKDDIDYRRGRWNQKMTEADKKIKAAEAVMERYKDVSDDDLKTLRDYKNATKSDVGRLSHIEKLTEGLDPKIANWFKTEVFPKLQSAGYNRQQFENDEIKRKNQELEQRLAQQTALEQFLENNKKARPVVKEQLEKQGVKLSTGEWDNFFDWHEERFLKGFTVPPDESYTLWASNRKTATKTGKTQTKTQPGQKKSPAKKETPEDIAKLVLAAA